MGFLQNLRRKRAQKKQLGKMPKEINFLFERHSAKGVADKTIKAMKEHDIILLEYTPETMKLIENLGPTKAASHVRYPEEENKLFREVLKQKRLHGKKIIFYDKWNRKMKRKMEEIEQKADEGDIIGMQKAMAEFAEMRDKENIKRIRKAIEENPEKKILISAGATHSPLYHELKKELKPYEKQGKVKINRSFSGGKSEREMKFNPLEQIVRMFRFKKNITPEDWKKIHQMEKEARKLIEKQEKLIEKYMKEEGLSKKQAIAKAHWETIKEE